VRSIGLPPSQGAVHRHQPSSSSCPLPASPFRRRSPCRRPSVYEPQALCLLRPPLCPHPRPRRHVRPVPSRLAAASTLCAVPSGPHTAAASAYVPQDVCPLCPLMPPVPSRPRRCLDDSARASLAVLAPLLCPHWLNPRCVPILHGFFASFNLPSLSCTDIRRPSACSWMRKRSSRCSLYLRYVAYYNLTLLLLISPAFPTPSVKQSMRASLS
jgi:hypothetical protein